MKIKHYFFATLLSIVSIASFAQGVLWHQNFDSIPQGSLPTNWTASAANISSIGWFADSSNFSTGLYTNASGLKNAVIKNTSNSTGVYALISPAFATTGKSGITVLWGSRVSSNFLTPGSTTPHLYYTTNAGATWDTTHYTDNAANSTWALVNGGVAIQLPSAADNQSSVMLKWQLQIDTAGSGTYRIDDVTVGFTGSASCTTPASLTATSITSTSATIGWATVSGALGYNVQYKLSSSSTWMSGNSTTNSFNLSGLTASSSYDYQIQTACSGSINSAFSATSTFTTLAGASGIENVNDNSPLTIYPNPASSVISIRSSVGSIKTIEVRNVMGQIVICPLLFDNSTNNCKLNTEHLPLGVYFLKTTANSGIQQVTKFIKE